jgi:hypothetical protein
MGVLAGVLAVAVALPSIPEFIALGAGPPLDYGIPVALFAATFVGLGAVLVLTVALAARGVVGRAPTGSFGGASL